MKKIYLIVIFIALVLFLKARSRRWNVMKGDKHVHYTASDKGFYKNQEENNTVKKYQE